MIRPKYICNDCTHKHICKYADDMSNLIKIIDEKCDYYTNNLPINLSAITCYRFQPHSINNSERGD